MTSAAAIVLVRKLLTYERTY